MRLIRFVSRDLNGYLNFDLDLSRDVSFLVGINGSGKTSVLRSIMALLAPDVSWISSARFDSISLHVIDDDIEREIVADYSDGVRRLVLRQQDKEYMLLFTADLISKLTRQTEEFVHNEDGDMVVVRDTRLEIPDTVEVVARIRKLPTPIFLGLDRTTLPIASRNLPRQRRRAVRSPHATLRSFLDDSVTQAEVIATSAIRSALLERSRRAEALRERVLFTLFSEAAEGVKYAPVPKQADLRKLETSRRSLKTAFSVLGIPKSNIEGAIDPFFVRAIDTASKLIGFKSTQEVFESGKQDAFFAWMNFMPQLSLIAEVETLVNEFNGDEKKIFEKIRRYEKIMNSFFVDSSKELLFDVDGELAIKMPSSESANVYYLSSGERQLFVLITNLMFNDDSKQANMVIIDEPELSLHIKWQEMFVDALLGANKNTQILLATHSPSIINNRDRFCVDLA